MVALFCDSRRHDKLLTDAVTAGTLEADLSKHRRSSSDCISSPYVSGLVLRAQEPVSRPASWALRHGPGEASRLRLEHSSIVSLTSGPMRWLRSRSAYDQST